MLPDGAWDNSWGSRNYKWTWWGSRTSDGCHPAYILLADHEPKFLEAAHRNLELMSACTHNNLLYGGPTTSQHGDQPCIHHTFTHAKSLATVLDSNVPTSTPNPASPSPATNPTTSNPFPRSPLTSPPSAHGEPPSPATTSNTSSASSPAEEAHPAEATPQAAHSPSSITKPSAPSSPPA